MKIYGAVFMFVGVFIYPDVPEMIGLTDSRITHCGIGAIIFALGLICCHIGRTDKKGN